MPTRISDLPNAPTPASTDRFPIDNGTTRSVELGNTIAGILNGAPIPVAAGGTGAATASGARTALGLGDSSVLDVGTTMTTAGGDLNVADEAITFAKMQNIATARLLGRSTSGTGDVETITIGTGLTLAAGELTSSLAGDFVAVDGSTPMTGPLVLPGAPTSALEAATKGYVDAQIDTVPAEAPIDGGLYARKNQAWNLLPIQSDAPANGSTYGRKDNAWIGVATLTDGDKGDITVASSGALWTVDNDAVTNAKLGNMAVNTIKGRITAGTGDPEDLTAAQVRSVVGQRWIALSDETLAANADFFTPVAIGSCQFVRLTLIVRPNPAASADFQTLWRLSVDGGSTFPSGPTDYANQSDTGTGSTAAAAAVPFFAGYLASTALKSSAIPIRVMAEFEKGGASYRASMLSKSYYFNGTDGQVFDVGSSYSTAGTATHLLILGDATNCFGIGSRLITEGLI